MKKNYSLCSSFKDFLIPKKQYTPLIFLLLFLGSLTSISAQKMERIPGEIVVCPAKFEDENSRMAMAQMASKKAFASTKKAATAELLITFGPGAEGNTAVQEAFQFALEIWSEEIVSSEPIRIFADFADLGDGVLASAGPTTLISNFPGAPQSDVFYPVALANSLAGEDLAPDLEFDLVVNIGNGIPWYFGTDGNTPAGQFDFVTVALHEAGHGLGFVDGGNVNNDGIGNINNGGNPFVFDTFIVDSQENSVLDIPNPSEELGDFLTSGDVFVNGQFAVAALGGVLPELFAPNPFQGGSSIAHWDEATFPAGDPNSLMSPQVGTAESNFDIGDITRGHFRDMGWMLAEQAPFDVVPNILSIELNIEETATREVTITNVSEGPLNLSSFPDLGAQIIQSADPAEFTLAAGESATVAINLSTEGVLAGLSQESITFVAQGFEVTEDVTINFRVLDGTEAPIIVVNPEVFNETIEQFSVVTRDLVIDNPGNDDLSFTISVGDNTMPNFTSRVTATNESIRANGFTKQKIVTKSARPNALTALQTVNGTINKIVSDLFAEDFEDLTLGDINGQSGWFGRFTDNWNVSNENAFEGSQHFRGVSDGLGGSQPAAPLALSPTFAVGGEPFSVMSAQVNIEGSGVSWEIIPQNSVQGSVVTRLRFNGDGTIDILDGGVGGFVPVNVPVPEGYFEVRIIIDRDTSGLKVFFDGELVHSGAGFATSIDNVALLSDMAVTGSSMDIDNLDVTDGDADAFFLSVAPISGVVPFGSSITASVTFDGRILEPGTTNATITINSNDTNNPSIDIPVSLTVLQPPSITVDPESITAAVDTTVDVPPIANDSFTISNSGGTPLNFTTSIGPTNFIAQGGSSNADLLKQLDRSKYGLGSNFSGTVKAAGSPGIRKIEFEKSILSNATVVTDSIFYDSGVEFPGDFVGLGAGAPGISTAIQFDVINQDFTLTAVRNAYRTEGLTDVAVLLQVFTGGTSPADGDLLLEQVVTGDSPNGVVVLETLTTPLKFSVGDSFWIVHSYPQGINFPQGVDDSITTTRPNTYAFSSDGGVTYTNLDGFAFLTRALSDGSGAFITLTPRTGTVVPGESMEVSVNFDGATLPNGVHETDISVESNDPLNPSVLVATSFEVSGQVSGIEVSDELLLFNDVFVGTESERSFTITNTGQDNLIISSIASDNPDFTISPESGVVESEDELEVTVTFAPTSTGSKNGIISITSNADGAGVVEVVVNGVGVVGPFAVLPENVEETVAEGKIVETTITLENDGESPLTFSFPEFTVAAALANPNIPMQVSEVLPFEDFSPVQEKGFKDSRVGAPVELSMGRDLQYGYTWIDSDEEGGPVNNFLDITPFPFAFDLTDFLVDDFGFGDGTVFLDLPFPFEFYGTEQGQLFINANGFLSFQQPTGLTFINGQIPVDDGINNIVAPFWADLEPQEGGSVHIALFADAVVVQWTNAPIFSADGSESGTVTFQIILFNDGTIDIYYDDVSSATFLDAATIGIENADASDGAQVAFNTPYVKDGLALRFIAPEIPSVPFITNVSPLSGVIPAGGQRSLTVTLDATELPPGAYLDELRVSSNSPDTSRSTALFELTVLEGPRVTGFTLVNADTDEPIGPLADGDVIDLADFPLGTEFNIFASAGDVPVGSIVFDFNDKNKFQIENYAPYGLRGDNGALELPLGINTLTATPFTASRGNGDSGLANTINFEVIRSLRPITYSLINADTDMVIGPLEDGAVIDLAEYPIGTEFNIEAIVDDIAVESVVFDFNFQDRFRVENNAPYTLANSSGLNLPIGINMLTTSGYSENRGQGTVIAGSTVSFEVISPVPPVTYLLINADTDTVLGSLGDGAIINLAEYQDGTEFNIEAVVEGISAGSVVFDFNGQTMFRVENFAPYALGGDRNGNFSDINLPLGNNTLTANVYSQSRARGIIIATSTISFEVSNTPVDGVSEVRVYPNSSSDIVNVGFINSSNRRLTGTLFNVYGQMVRSNLKFDFESSRTGSFSIATLTRGIYILELRDEKGQIISQSKLIKK